MLRSVKSQIVFATSLIIIVILGATAYFVVDQKAKEINHDIFVKSVSFAELTRERIVANYEDNYRQQAYANFDKEMSDIYSMDTDVMGIAIINYQGENLYVDPKIREHHGKLSDEDLERVQAVYASVRVQKSGRVVYIEKTDSGTRYTDFNGRDVAPIADTEPIEDIYYPFRDPNNALRSYTLYFHVSYAAVAERVKKTVENIAVMALFGIAIALFIGGIVAGRITSPIKALSEGAGKLGAGDLKTRIEVKSESEIGMLAETFNQMASDLETSTKAMIEKEKLTHELELAGEIQRELLPKTLPAVRGLDIAASLSSADEVGGDCYDFIAIDEDKLLFYIGDVTGHGVPAGLVSAINNALVPAFLGKTHKTDELVVELNRILKMKTRPNVFMTMVMCVWSSEHGDLRFTQAGHDPILHFRAADRSVSELAAGGMALGMLPDISKVVKSQTVSAGVGDVFVLYTDGIPEAWRSEKENFGMGRFKESVKKYSGLSTAKEIHDALLKDVRDFMAGYPQADDITLIVGKRTA
ncbi:SpoIIE family protein phosphatase [Candidatus Peregrinibacteria bacterium]|nr:SpoIIE family protein phosphatase [Candidatus Peregrinibacteria bacterium]